VAPAQQPQRGGVLRIGIPDPPALDPHQVVNADGLRALS